MEVSEMEVGTIYGRIIRLAFFVGLMTFLNSGISASTALAQPGPGSNPRSKEYSSRGIQPSSGPLGPEDSRLLADQIARSQARVRPSLTGTGSSAPLEAQAAPVIDVWYGLNQTFGQLGTPQNWVNILGTVTADEGLSTLEYTLNGGSSVALATGPDDRRLAEPGDFNIDLDIGDLNEGVNTVVITATDALSVPTIATVTVNYSGLNTWPLPYSVDWDTVTDLQDAAQIVDGKWEILAGGLRTTQVDYDRVIDFGDLAWDNYEVTTTVTLHGSEEPGPLSGSSGGMGFVSRWLGHSDSPAEAAGYQPKSGWLPSGGACYYSLFPAQINVEEDFDPSVDINIGDTVNWKFRVETPPGQGGRYSVKIWPFGQTEPAAWNLVKQRGLDDEPNGSLIFYAHHTDVTLGDISIVEVPLVIGNVQVLHTSSTTAQVTWTTDEPSSSRVDFGLTTAYGAFESDAALVTEHSVNLTGLSPNTEYHFQVTSIDAGTYEARSDDAVFDTTPATIVSDDFNSCEINPLLWTAVDPLGDAVIGLDGSRLQISIPASATTGHGAWGTGPGDFENTLPRLMQPASDTDFQVEVKFESPLTAGWQSQGVMIEQDVNDLLMVDFTVTNVNSTQMRALKIVDGEGFNFGDWGVPIAANGTTPLYMRINRTGDVWTLSYSFDNATWGIYKVFNHPMNVSAMGVYAGNGGTPIPAFTANIDYFFNAVSPISPEDPLARSAPVLAAIGDRAMQPNDSLTINLSATDGDLDPIILTQAGVPGFATFTDFGNGTGEIVMNPGPGDIGDFDITVTATDSPCGLTDFETFTVHIGTVELSTLVSDDFNACVLNTTLWTLFDPDGDATFGANGNQAEITVPAGTTHDLWGNGPGDYADNLPRLMQAANDVDFEIEVRFESGLSESWQSEGLIIEQDANDLLRIEFGVNTSNMTTMAIYSIVDGAGSPIGGWGTEIAPAGTTPLRLKTQRVGNFWTVSYSIDDGSNWVVYQSFAHVMAVSAAGFHCGNGGTNQPAHTAQADFFFNNASPIAPEDPIVFNAPDLAPVGNQMLAEEESLTVGVSATDDDLDPLTLTAAVLPGFATFTDYGNGTGDLELNPLLTDTGIYQITITATDPCGLFDDETITVTVGTGEPSIIVSDDFNACTLDYGRWTAFDPDGDATFAANGNQAQISVPEGTTHDAWGTGPGDFVDNLPRLMQPANNVDFAVEARFESPLTTPLQTQGFIFEQDANNLLRIDLGSNETPMTTIAVLKITDGAGANYGGWGTVICPPGTAPLRLKTQRLGDLWTVSYSLDDGVNWVEYLTFTHAMTVTAAGFHCGNGGAIHPAFTTSVDFFFNASSPIIPEDSIVFSAPVLAAIGNQTMDEETSLTVPVSATDVDLETLVLEAEGLPGFATFNDFGDGTGELQLDPLATDTGSYPITITATDPCGLFDFETITVQVGTSPVTNLVSDDFNCSTLDTQLWTFVNPLGDATLSGNGTQAVISLPGGGAVHDLWGSGPGDFLDTMVRLEQATNNADFEAEARFESGLTDPWQTQGMIIAQDANDLLRLEFLLTDIGTTKIAVFKVVDGAASNIGGWGTEIAPTGTTPLLMRVNRQGDLWTVSYSIDDGGNWVDYQIFTHPMIVATAGVHFGNGGNPVPAHTGIVDYFFNTASPIVPEDGVTHDSPVLAAITDQNMAVLETLNVPLSATDPSSDPIVLTAPGLPAFGSLTDLGDGTGSLDFNPGAGDFGVYPIMVVASDPCADPDTVLFNLTVTSGGASALVSDDFNSCTLNAGLWEWTDPQGDSAHMLSGAQLLITVPSNVAHTVSGTGSGDFANNTARLTQSVIDSDFNLEIFFEAGISLVGQGQGLMIGQDAENLLVVDFVGETVGQTSLRARTFVAGAATEVGLVDIGLTDLAPLGLRIGRVGNDWTVAYSIDSGFSWPVFQTFNHALAVSEIGIVASNAGQPAPMHNVVVDYIFDQAAPISPEDATPCAVPGEVTDLAASGIMTGFDGDGNAAIDLSWSAVTCAVAVDVYRKGFGDYPSYAGGAVPTTPTDPAQALAEGWELAASVPATMTGFRDEPAQRDYYYYVAMVRNGCGDVSAVSNQPEGALNYLLGDVFDGTTPGQGNNQVAVEDITLLGGSYGVDSSNQFYLDFLDIGPTETDWITGRPQPDNQIEFEDLILYSINYGAGSSGPAPADIEPDYSMPATNEVALQSEAIPQAGQTFGINLTMRANGDLQAVSIPVEWDDQVIEFVQMQPGDFMNQQTRQGIVLQSAPGVVDAAVLGVGQTGIVGQGTLAILTFRVIGAGDPGLALGNMLGRDKQNQNVAVTELVVTGVDDLTPTPQMTTLHQNAPNPFNPMTEVSFEIAKAGRVRVRIYSVDGALVMTLLDEDLSPGRYDRIWNGKDRNGRQVASGTYLLRLETGGTVQSKRMMLLK